MGFGVGVGEVRLVAHVVRGGVIGMAVLACALAGCASSRDASAARNDHRTVAASDGNRELMRAAFERWRAGTGGPFELLADEATWTITGSSPLSKKYGSKRQFMDEVIAPFNARLTNPLVPTVRGMYADGDTVVVHFDGVAIAKDGVQYRNSYAWFMRMQDGKAVEVTAFFDTRLFDEFWGRVSPTK